MSHSKRNTAAAFFTSYERSLLKSAWGSRSTRLSRDSLLPFGSCQLCLLPARDPVSCATHGDLFCRECAVANLLSQRQEIKRLERDYQRRREEREARDGEADERARELEVREFERTQLGLTPSSGAARGKKREEAEQRGIETNGFSEAQRGTKRRFALDEAQVQANNLEERERARRKLDAADDAERQKTRLPSFWVASQTPSSDKTEVPEPESLKLNPICPSSSEDAPHGLSLKSLIAVKFHESRDAKAGEETRSCPACDKALNNATGAMLARCGHVLCTPCANKFVLLGEKDEHGMLTGPARCYVCDADLSVEPTKEKTKDKSKKALVKPIPPEKLLIKLNSDGTGFASAGKSEVKKKGIAFQC